MLLQEKCFKDEYECKSPKICVENFCICPPWYYDNNGSCSRCLDIYEPCDVGQCCGRSNLGCIKGLCRCITGLDTGTCGYNGPTYPVYMSASQIALSAALIMGMAALSMVVYRLCTKPRYLSARQRALASQMGFNIENETLSYATYLRASLTSMQIRVLSRMRDRPPTYDNRPSAITLPEAPPPYEGVSEAIAQPPPYIEVVVSTTGYTNATYINSQTDVPNNRNVVCPNCDSSQHRRIDTDCDTESRTSKKIETCEES